jgi:hypothetical protein
MHLEDELDNVLREQILERERFEKLNVDSGSDEEEDEGEGVLHDTQPQNAISAR